MRHVCTATANAIQRTAAEPPARSAAGCGDKALTSQLGASASGTGAVRVRRHDDPHVYFPTPAVNGLSGDELLKTEGLTANMLEVRRDGAAEAALGLQKRDFIQYAGGNITVVDRLELECKVCDCYRVVKKEYERLLTDKEAV